MLVWHTSAPLCALAALLLAAAAAAQEPATPVRLTGVGPNAATQGLHAAAFAQPADAQAAALATYPPIHSGAPSPRSTVAFSPGDSQARNIIAAWYE